MKQISSAITTPQKVQSSAIGMPRGEHGLATQGSSRVAEWLAHHHPSEVDTVLQSQASSLNVELRMVYDTRRITDTNGNSTTEFYTKGAVATGSPDDVARFSEKAIAAMTPADAPKIEAWLAELSVLVARRREDEFSETLRIEAYASRLKAYPADVVRHALLEHQWRFWPSWVELSSICEKMTANRRAMANASAPRIVPPEEPNRKPDAETRARLAAELLGNFTPKRMDAAE